MMSADKYKALEEALGYQFKDKNFLHWALTHASYPQKEKDNERLEFLGDRVLGLTLSKHLFSSDKYEVGKMAHQLSLLASGSVCAQVAWQLRLFTYALLSKGLSEDWESNESVHSNLCEALIGAIYLDGGFEQAEACIHKLWRPWLENDLEKEVISPKNVLQERAQQKGVVPVYNLVSQEGADHKPLFVVEVLVEGLGSAQGSSSSRQKAEKIAAQNLLEQLK